MRWVHFLLSNSLLTQKWRWYTLGMRSKKDIEQTTKRMSTPAFFAVLFVVGIVIIGGAVLLGKSDNGQINVSATIQNSNQANKDANGDASNNVDVVPPQFQNMTNGGLVAQENQPAPEEAPKPEDTATGTTTENGASDTATSTETGEATTENITETSNTTEAPVN